MTTRILFHFKETALGAALAECRKGGYIDKSENDRTIIIRGDEIADNIVFVDYDIRRYRCVTVKRLEPGSKTNYETIRFAWDDEMAGPEDLGRVFNEAKMRPWFNEEFLRNLCYENGFLYAKDLAWETTHDGIVAVHPKFGYIISETEK